MSSYRFVHVDVFTRQPFGGNQLAVFTEAQGLSDAQMQAIAFEMNFSESTFVLPADQPRADSRVRVFTPSRELPFAGHPVVGTGYVLAVEQAKPSVALQLQIGTLRVEVEPGADRAGSARMEQPLPSFRPAEADEAVLAALVGLAPADVEPSVPAAFGSAGVEFLFLPLGSLEALQRARGDATAMGRFFEDPGHAAIYLFTLETRSPEAAAHARMLSLLLGSEVREDPGHRQRGWPLWSLPGPPGTAPARSAPGRARLRDGAPQSDRGRRRGRAW